MRSHYESCGRCHRDPCACPTACRELTAEREAQARRLTERGRWGIVVREHAGLNCTCRVWFGTDETAAGLIYSAWIDAAPERMRQLADTAALAPDLLAALDAARAKLAEVEAERECRVSNSLTCGFVQTWRDAHAASVVELDRLTGIFGDIIEACDPDADDGLDALTAARRCAAERDAAVTRAERAEAALVALREAANKSVATRVAFLDNMDDENEWALAAKAEEEFDALRAALAATPEALAAKYDETLREVARAARGDVTRWKPRPGQTDEYIGTTPLTDAECNAIIASVRARRT